MPINMLMENKKHNLDEAYLNSLTREQRLKEMKEWTPHLNGYNTIALKGL